MITITSAPYPFNPVSNHNIWQLVSSNSATVYFQVSIIETTTSDIILNNKYHIRPDFNGVAFDLSDILANTVELKHNHNLNTIVAPIASASLTYRLTITEKILVDDVIVDGDTYNNGADKFTVWDSKLDRLLYSGYQMDNYVVNNNKLAKFLSLKEQISDQTGTSTEFLYFANGNYLAKQVRIRTYNTSGVQLGNNVANIPSGFIQRLNVSPKALNNIFSIDFSSVGHYRVDLLDVNGEVISETKIYKYTFDNCTLQPVNLLFQSSLGAFESVTLYNPKESITTTKTTLKTNVLQLNGGVYSDNTNNILNPTDKIINVNSLSTFTVTSLNLSDNEIIRLKELITSNCVYVELSDNTTLVPVTIKNNNYQVLQKRTNGYKLNKLEIQYEVQSGFIPSKSDLFGSGSGNAQIQFLDLPLPVSEPSGIIYIDSSGGSITI